MGVPAARLASTRRINSKKMVPGTLFRRSSCAREEIGAQPPSLRPGVAGLTAPGDIGPVATARAGYRARRSPAAGQPCHDVPDHVMVGRGVAVDEAVAPADDLAPGNRPTALASAARHLARCFAYDRGESLQGRCRAGARHAPPKRTTPGGECHAAGTAHPTMSDPRCRAFPPSRSIAARSDRHGLPASKPRAERRLPRGLGGGKPRPYQPRALSCGSGCPRPWCLSR